MVTFFFNLFPNGIVVFLRNKVYQILVASSIIIHTFNKERDIIQKIRQILLQILFARRKESAENIVILHKIRLHVEIKRRHVILVEILPGRTMVKNHRIQYAIFRYSLYVVVVNISSDDVFQFLFVGIENAGLVQRTHEIAR